MKKFNGFWLLFIYYTEAQLKPRCTPTALPWRHNDCGGVSNHQPHDCLLNRIFGRISKEHQSSASLAFVREIHRGPVNFPRKWPVTRKMFPFDDVIMGDRVHCYATVVHQHLQLTNRQHLQLTKHFAIWLFCHITHIQCEWYLWCGRICVWMWDSVLALDGMDGMIEMQGINSDKQSHMAHFCRVSFVWVCNSSIMKNAFPQKKL